ncbi:MAG: hypothetical protein IPH89_16125 [Bacteroidetes bacterium]|nr:hypothetical protein [Bacteroidota bacterium]
MQKDFNNLITTFKSSIKTWDYFVNWKKVFANSSDLGNHSKQTKLSLG